MIDAHNSKQILKSWQAELAAKARPEKIEILQSFFKTGKGQYGEGDVFIGVKVPDNRAVSRKFADAPFAVVGMMLESEVHEHRLAAALCLVRKYELAKKSEEQRAEVVTYYLDQSRRLNNWDLVDLSAPYIIGEELIAGRHHDTIRQLVKSDNLWQRRIAMVSTLRPVMRGKDTDLAIEMATTLLTDQHDLIRKAVGWILREVGKKDIELLRAFLSTHIKEMSSITLSYATEKMTPEERKKWRECRKS
jgi:3-methyladenine DNA glycosylase AlkD